MLWYNLRKLFLHMTGNQGRILFIFFENRSIKIISEFFIISFILKQITLIHKNMYT